MRRAAAILDGSFAQEGRWEGGTLVVDTTHLTPGTFMNNGFNHSDAQHMVERFRASADGNTLWLVQTYEDPRVFEGLAARYTAAAGP